MRFIKTISYFCLTLMILSLSGGLAHAKHDKGKGKVKHKGMDHNHDSVITREEWRGNDKSFRNQDWNHDGVLSGDEVRSGNQANRSFEQLDRNGDGKLSQDEFDNRVQRPLAEQIFQEIFRK